MSLGFGSFSRDANSSGLTPEELADQIKRAREMAAQNDGSPVGHWTQAVGRAMASLNAGLQERAAREAGKNAASSFTNDIFTKLTGAPAASTAATGDPAMSGNPMNSPPIRIDEPNEVKTRFMSGVQQAGLTNPFALAAVAATGNRESRFSPGNMNRTWADPSESGQAGTSGGIMSWRAERLANLQSFARQRGESGLGSPETQAAFMAQEDKALWPRLNQAKSVEEAAQVMANAWRFAGYDRPGGEAAARVETARAYLPMFQGGQATAQPAVQRGPVTARVQTLEDRGNNQYEAVPLVERRSVAPIPGDNAAQLERDAAAYEASNPEAARQMRERAQMARAGTQQAQAAPSTTSATDARPATPQTNLPSSQQVIAAMSHPGFAFATKGQQAALNMMLQQAIAREGKDPNEAALRQEQLAGARLGNEKARRDLGRVEMETMTAPDGTVFEREKGKAGAQWTQTIKLPQKPDPGTTDQKELAQINRERKAAGQPELTMEDYQKARSEQGKGGVKRSIQPIYGTDAQGNTVLLQPGDDGRAVQTELPPGVKVSAGIDRLDAGTEFILVDKRTGLVVGRQPKDLRGAEREKGIGDAEGKAAAGISGTVATMDKTLATINGVLNDKNLDFTLSPRGLVARNVPFTQSTGSMARIQQLQGQAFLQAFESLKGGGAITEIEGKKATEAIARLNANQSPKDFREALGELRDVVIGARERAIRGVQRSGQPTPEASAVPDRPAAPGGFRVIGVQ